MDEAEELRKQMYAAAADNRKLRGYLHRQFLRKDRFCRWPLTQRLQAAQYIGTDIFMIPFTTACAEGWHSLLKRAFFNSLQNKDMATLFSALITLARERIAFILQVCAILVHPLIIWDSVRTSNIVQTPPETWTVKKYNKYLAKARKKNKPRILGVEVIPESKFQCLPFAFTHSIYATGHRTLHFTLACVQV
eukprot:gb/GECG01004087.1/.p1 GENE.gb/GECG01004087.1/~~gb/GECG01004087.1/.p1  ORF type:complete len:192 (+),score=12.03 gb/GECG01004087.1/:1-576(+)